MLLFSLSSSSLFYALVPSILYSYSSYSLFLSMLLFSLCSISLSMAVEIGGYSLCTAWLVLIVNWVGCSTSTLNRKSQRAQWKWGTCEEKETFSLDSQYLALALIDRLMGRSMNQEHISVHHWMIQVLSKKFLPDQLIGQGLSDTL